MFEDYGHTLYTFTAYVFSKMREATDTHYQSFKVLFGARSLSMLVSVLHFGLRSIVKHHHDGLIEHHFDCNGHYQYKYWFRFQRSDSFITYHI